jgi:thiol-disulfide isomerase/thioredoxin
VSRSRPSLVCRAMSALTLASAFAAGARVACPVWKGTRKRVSCRKETGARGALVVLASVRDTNFDADTSIASTSSSNVSRRLGLALAVTASGALALGLAETSPALALGAASGLDSIIELTPMNFATEVESPNAGRVFVEFYAPWCPFCQKLEPVWNGLPGKLRENNVATKIARMNVDTYTDYGAAYGITGFPTLMLFQDGKPIGQKTGLIDERTALKYAGVKDDSIVANLGPKPQMNLVLNGPQVDAALDDVQALKKAVELIPAGEAKTDAASRLKALEIALSKRAL